MLDGIFFINSAIGVKHLSLLSEKDRFDETIKTIESIDKYCPNNAKYIFDSSCVPYDRTYIEEFTTRGIKFLDLSENTGIKRLSNLGHKNIAECLSLLNFLEWFNNNMRYARRIYKISARYELNDNFQIMDQIERNFIFAKAQDSWMAQDMQDRSGATKFYNTKLWSMDFSMLPIFQKELKNILIDCERYSLDIEHSFYKNLKKYHIKELEKIGVCGKSASSGEFIDE